MVGGRRRRGALVIAVVAVLLAGAGVAAFLVVGADEAPGVARDGRTDAEPVDPAVTPPNDTDEDDEGSDPAPTVTITADPGPDESPTPTAPAPREARCWDGARAPTVSGCSAPSGTAGLRWVVPGFDFAGENCVMTPVRLEATRRFHYNCPSDGTDRVYFNFSEFDTNEWGRTYHEGKAGFSPYPTRGFLRWDYSIARGEYKTALMYETARWGVTIYSDDAVLRDEAAARLLRRFRPVSELRGLPG